MKRYRISVTDDQGDETLLSGCVLVNLPPEVEGNGTQEGELAILEGAWLIMNKNPLLQDETIRDRLERRMKPKGQ